MSIAISIPFWMVLLIILVIGFGIAFLIPEGRNYDFLTPMISFCIICITIFLVIGLALGKYVF